MRETRVICVKLVRNFRYGKLTLQTFYLEKLISFFEVTWPKFVISVPMCIMGTTLLYVSEDAGKHVKKAVKSH